MKESIDTSTPCGRFMVQVFASLAELERNTINMRRQETINAMKEAGTYKTGRPPLEIDEKKFCEVVKKWRNGEMYFCAALNFRKKLSPLASKRTIIETFSNEIDFDAYTFGGWWTIKYNYGIYTYQEFYDSLHRILSNAVTVDRQQIMPDGDKIRIIGWIAPDDFEDYFKEEFGIEDE